MSLRFQTARHAGVPTDVVEAAALVSQCTHELMLDLGEEFTDGVNRCDTDEQWRDVHHHAARVPQHRRSPSGHRNMNLDSLFRRHPREVQRERSDDRCSVVLGFVEKGTTSVRHQCAFESALGLRGPEASARLDPARVVLRSAQYSRSAANRSDILYRSSMSYSVRSVAARLGCESFLAAEAEYRCAMRFIMVMAPKPSSAT